MKQSNLRHVVLLSFKSSASASDIQVVEVAFARLETRINSIAALEWGTNVSPEQHHQGFTHCFLLTFESETNRDTYLIHPEHLEFGNLLRPQLENICVVDYWT